jgi:hypothetical protein
MPPRSSRWIATLEASINVWSAVERVSFFARSRRAWTAGLGTGAAFFSGALGGVLGGALGGGAAPPGGVVREERRSRINNNIEARECMAVILRQSRMEGEPEALDRAAAL